MAVKITKRWHRAALVGLVLVAAIFATASWQMTAACAVGIVAAVALLAYADRGAPRAG